MGGRTYIQWKVGDHIAHAQRHTVTAEENRQITVMTHNPQPLHLDAHFSETTEFGQRLFKI